MLFTCFMFLTQQRFEISAILSPFYRCIRGSSESLIKFAQGLKALSARTRIPTATVNIQQPV